MEKEIKYIGSVKDIEIMHTVLDNTVDSLISQIFQTEDRVKINGLIDEVLGIRRVQLRASRDILGGRK